jgi:hypothetical protein
MNGRSDSCPSVASLLLKISRVFDDALLGRHTGGKHDAPAVQASMSKDGLF